MTPQPAPSVEAGPGGAAAEGERFLCFNLGSEPYAMPLLAVIEVIAPPEITPVPQMPGYFVGIMNLRGQIISVIDLRVKLGIVPTKAAETAIIICDTRPNSLGIIVDSINSVLTPRPDAISSKPALQGARPTDYVRGVFRHEQRLVLLIDIAKTLSLGEMQAVAAASKPITG